MINAPTADPLRPAQRVFDRRHAPKREPDKRNVNREVRNLFPETWAEMMRLREAGVSSLSPEYQTLLERPLSLLEWRMDRRPLSSTIEWKRSRRTSIGPSSVTTPSGP